MRLFAPLYDQTLRWASHSRAPWALSALSFVESIIFPIPTDVMLAPMVLAQAARNGCIMRLLQRFSRYSVVSSGTCWEPGHSTGLRPGFWPMMGLRHLLRHSGCSRSGGSGLFSLQPSHLFPYKVFTISAGFMALALVPFIIASAVGRAARFFLVAGLVRLGGCSV